MFEHLQGGLRAQTTRRGRSTISSAHKKIGGQSPPYAIARHKVSCLARRRFLRPVVEKLEARELLALITVTRLDDAVGTGDGVTLREAILAANTNVSVDGSAAGQAGPMVDAIQFQPDFLGTISLELGQLQITETVSISGNATAGTIIDAQGESRVLDIINTAGEVTLENLTLTGGKTILATEFGGGVRSRTAGKLTIRNSTIAENSTAGGVSHGGGVYSLGPIIVVDSTFSGNSTAGPLARGGGIYSEGAVTVINSTLSGNSTMGTEGSGGGIYGVLGVTVDQSTITGNSVAGASANGGGIFSFSGPLTVRNSIVAGNNDFENGSHPELSLSQAGTRTIQHSLIGDGTGSGLSPTLNLPDGNGNQVGTAAAPIEARLGPLEFRGGPTKTHSLLPDSPAIDAGDINFAVPPVFDQRGSGFDRKKDGPDDNTFARVDIGAFEFQSSQLPGNLTVDTTSDLDDSNYSAGNLSLREAIVLANLVMDATTIVFNPALDGQPIRLINGQMTIDLPVMLLGRGAASTIIDGQRDSRLFEIGNVGGGVTFDGLMLTGGRTTADFEGGGAIHSNYAASAVTIQNCTISGNSTDGDNAQGGGIFANGPVTVTSSTISGNSTVGSASTGGGIYANGALTVTSSTISDNRTYGANASGGGIYANLSVEIIHSTITANVIYGASADGGGLNVNGPPTIRNSIVAGNLDDENDSHPNLYQFAAGVPNLHYSLIGDATGTELNESNPVPDLRGNIIGGKSTGIIDARLGPLQFNGGPTQTHKLLANSPALEKASFESLLVTPIGVMSATDATDFWKAGRLIDGSALSTTPTLDNYTTVTQSETQDTAWVTTDFFPNYYTGGGPIPELTFDLGGLFTLTSIVVWGYNPFGVNNNEAKGLEVLFSSDGGATFSSPNTLTHARTAANQQTLPFVNLKTANVVKVRVTSNYDGEPGAGGGDRVGLGEIRFLGTPATDQRGLARIADGPDLGTFASADMGAFELALVPFSLIVTTADDEVDAGADAADLSLREAIGLANGALGNNFVTFDLDLAGQPILLKLGQMTIGDELLLQGLGARKTVIDGQQRSRLFDVVQSAGDVTFDGLTFTGGRTTADDEDGGAIRSRTAGQLTIQNSIFSGNSTTGRRSDGGGIYADGPLAVTTSTISGNSTAGGGAGGGGIAARDTLRVTGSTISGNSTSGEFGEGGGISADGPVDVIGSTVSANSTTGSSSGGGGISADGALRLTNSTVSGNSTTGEFSSGGGIHATRLATVTNSTITGNLVFGANSDGGGASSFLGSLTIRNSIVAGNEDREDNSSPDVFQEFDGPPIVQFSLIGDNNGTGLDDAPVGSPDDDGNLIGTHEDPIDPLLGPLIENGGRTLTHRPLAGSPVIDAGEPNLAQDPITNEPLTTDQRGLNRGVGNSVDMGAVELGVVPFPLVVTTVDDELDLVPTADDLSLREAIVLANGGQGSETISFDHNLSGQPIRLTLGQMTIGDSVTVLGRGTAATIIHGQNQSRLFNIVSSPGGATFDQLTLTGGRTTGENEQGGAIRSDGASPVLIRGSVVTGNSTSGDASDGGGIYAGTALTIDNSTISGNFTSGAVADGGGAYSGGTLTVTSSTISGNSTAGDGARGGGIFSRYSVRVTGSTISGNSTGGRNGNGGGIYSQSISVTVLGSTISGNFTTGFASGGGGIYGSDVQITNSTISGNFTTGERSSGGGIHAYILEATNSTITGNYVRGEDADGGGIATHGDAPSTIANSIVAGNHDHEDDSHPDLFQGSGLANIDFSLIGDNNGTGLSPAPVGSTNPDGNLIGTHSAPIDPLLSPLQPNFGPTLTHRPLAGSPVINKGSNSLAVDLETQLALVTDQRGLARIIATGGTVDMGAFELGPVPFPLVVTTVDDELDGVAIAADLSLREAVGLANGGLGADTITFAAALTDASFLLGLGQITIGDSVTIRGSVGDDNIDGRGRSRLFAINEGAGDVTFDRLTLKSGRTSADFEGGGAISSATAGQLTIRNSIITGNETTGDGSSGGGILAFGPVTIAVSTITGNSVEGFGSSGGGIYSGYLLTVTSSIISGNSTDDGVGGGIAAIGPATVANSAIYANSVDGRRTSGGGIFAYSALTVTGSTISGNAAFGEESAGGGIYAYDSLSLLNSTVVANRVYGEDSYGGGVRVVRGSTISNSIITGNIDDEDGSHPNLDFILNQPNIQFSFVGDATGSGLTEANPGPDINGNIIGGPDTGVLLARLAPLDFNFNPTPTHALCTGIAQPHPVCTAASPLINAGSNALIPADEFDVDGDGNTAELLPLDQRGAPFARVFGAAVDMGAFEVQPGLPWHNFAKPFDVGGGQGNQPDRFIVAGDALAIINYLNAFGAGPIPANAAFGQPFGFLDTSGGPSGVGDNFITAGDALDIINFLNAGLGGEGEPEGSHGGQSRVYAADVQPVLLSNRVSLNELIGLLAIDLASQSSRRR